MKANPASAIPAETAFDEIRARHAAKGKARQKLALAYIERLETYVMGFEGASERDTRHDHIRQGLRTTDLGRRLPVAFEVTADRVTILGFFSGGRDWTAIPGDGG